MTPISYAYVGQCCQYTSRNKGVSHLFSVPSDGVDAVFCLERLRRGVAIRNPLTRLFVGIAKRRGISFRKILHFGRCNRVLRRSNRWQSAKPVCSYSELTRFARR